MSISELIVRVLITILVLLIMARLSGPKQISQMSFYDYVSGITVGSLAASSSTNSSLALSNGLIAIVLFLSSSILMGWLSAKSMTARRLLTGKPVVLIAEGKIRWKGLKKARINMNELLSSLRYGGYFSLDDVAYAVFEPTGKLSVQPKGCARPPKTSELDLKVPEPGRQAEVIIDGSILRKNLEEGGWDEAWLDQKLKGRGIKNLKEVALALVDSKGSLTIYKKESE